MAIKPRVIDPALDTVFDSHDSGGVVGGVVAATNIIRHARLNF